MKKFYLSLLSLAKPQGGPYQNCFLPVFILFLWVFSLQGCVWSPTCLAPTGSRYNYLCLYNPEGEKPYKSSCWFTASPFGVLKNPLNQNKYKDEKILLKFAESGQAPGWPTPELFPPCLHFVSVGVQPTRVCLVSYLLGPYRL